MGNKCFKVYTNEVIWENAEKACQEIPGYHLAKIESTSEQDELNAHLATEGYTMSLSLTMCAVSSSFKSLILLA